MSTAGLFRVAGAEREVMLSKAALQNPRKRGGKLYERIEGMICERIRDGTLKPGTRLDNIDELAEELQVSSGTVRHSLQNLAARGILVRRPRAGTFVAGSESRNFAPPGKRSETSQVILLLLPDITHPEYAHLARFIQDAAMRLQIDVLVGNTDDQVERYEEIIYRQLANGIYGIVMVPPFGRNLSLSLLSEIQKNNVPVVTIFRSIPTLGWPTVLNDFYHSVEAMTQHLCDIGCKRIAFANLSESPEIMYTKHYAFLRALMSAQRTTHAELLLTVPYRPSRPSAEYIAEEKRAIREWLSQHPTVDGICCIHDELAVAIIEQLQQLGRRVPEDVVVTGSGNFAQFYGLDTIELTTVDPSFDQIAEQVFDLLRRMRDGEQIPEGTKVAIKGKLIFGRSTAKPAQSKRSHSR